MGAYRVVVVDLPIGPPFEHFLECDPRLHAFQGRSQAEVDALSEAQVSALPVDVETVGIGEMRLVAVRRPVE